MPEEYRKQNPNKYSNLLNNKDKLLSPFDIYATIRDLSCLRSQESVRSISLFNKIPSNRTCENIDISNYFCTCRDWNSLDEKSHLVLQASKYTLEYINSLIKPYNECKTLTLDAVLLSKFYEFNNIFYILLKLKTAPNAAIYELQVEYSNNRFQIAKSADISRLDSYKSQSFCIEKLKSKIDLRKFCNCK